MVESLRLFFSYSHKDEALRDELASHLKILEHQKLIASWHDRKILPGDEWDHQITVNQDTADIILLLISSDFIASKYCWDIEITRAMELHESGKACVVPVILRDVDWTNAPFSKLQAVPQNAQPVNNYPTGKDAAFKFITQQIRQVATGLIERRRKLIEQQQKDSAIATYRQKFEEFAADGEISFGEQFLLDELQQELKLTDADVQAIRQSILNPVADPQQLERYRQFFVKTIAQYGYPFSGKVRQELKLVQNYLNLTDTDIAPIEAPLIAQKEAEQQEQQRQAEAFKQQQSLEQQRTADSKPRIITPTVATDDLSSEKGIDYTRLRDLLKAQQWREADQETADRMLEAIGKEKWIDVKTDDLLSFPCADLRTIDSLWVKYSGGRFGFSVQKQIYVECGAKLDGKYPGDEIWKRFGDRVGWRKDGAWSVRTELNPSLSSPGNFPLGFRVLINRACSLFSRTETCRL